MPRQTARIFSRRQGSKQRDGRRGGPSQTPGDDTAVAAFPCPLLLLFVSAAAVATLYRFAVWSVLRCKGTALPSAWPAISTGSPIEDDPCKWVPFSICVCFVHSV
ncbi:hypothetical protein TcG_10445 [Trypanosoma cruzi]|nr:hypothetical protein TcG_10445 [Trypanosoma cruzi]